MRYLKSFLKYFLLQTIYISLICFESLFNQPSTKQNKKSHSRSISLAFVKIEVSWIKLKIVFNQLVHLTISSSSSLNLNRFSLIFQSFIFIFYLSLKIERKLIWGLIIKKNWKSYQRSVKTWGQVFISSIVSLLYLYRSSTILRLKLYFTHYPIHLHLHQLQSSFHHPHLYLPSLHLLSSL